MNQASCCVFVCVSSGVDMYDDVWAYIKSGNACVGLSRQRLQRAWTSTLTVLVCRHLSPPPCHQSCSLPIYQPSPQNTTTQTHAIIKWHSSSADRHITCLSTCPERDTLSPLSQTYVLPVAACLHRHNRSVSDMAEYSATNSKA